ncbi:hypothetical protein PCANC_23464 [Puccinia coronata f. sp. avenae]|uniref:Uncharacterized protein n=1 Tax=Puccinia coronata f. sp. avenae TaxID=200324 RepID=A0A2N5T968_9BASI|nr:hypothetical protein PCASD_19450 [Puccinia coronata f. sp. avenae]PLW29111.1 hypothetical protein PCANC_23464 [Puccinia coronata f. sp. avenae]PLW32259.1 hypothetical protein PCASD_17824 [Puccinia coronata f. sp. avenae]
MPTPSHYHGSRSRGSSDGSKLNFLRGHVPRRLAFIHRAKSLVCMPTPVWLLDLRTGCGSITLPTGPPWIGDPALPSTSLGESNARSPLPAVEAPVFTPRPGSNACSGHART